jgi:hypothetical protein
MQKGPLRKVRVVQAQSQRAVLPQNHFLLAKRHKYSQAMVAAASAVISATS